MSLNNMRIAFHSSAKWILGFVTVAMLVVAFSGLGANLGHNNPPAGGGQQQNTNATIATVNGEAITTQEYGTAYDQAKQEQQMYGGGGSQSLLTSSQTRSQALQQVINETLAAQIAKAAGVTVSDADIAKAREAQLGQVKTELSLPASASDSDVNAALAPQGLSIDTILPDGLFRKQLAVQNYQNMLKQNIAASDAAIQEYYKQVHARHILISNTTRPDAQAKALAQNLIGRLKAGADFAALAKQYSDDPGSKNKGGDDGWISQTTQYVPEFLKAALSLQKGQITPQPVLSPQYGYFIIQVLDTKENLPKDYAKNQPKYRAQVASFLQNQAMQNAFQTATKNAKIVVDDPLLRAYRTMSQPAPGQAAGYINPTVAADLQTALKTADSDTKPEIYAQLAMIDEQLNKTADEISMLKQALNLTEDAQLRVMLGDAYRKTGDTKDALAQYQTASTNSYDDPQVHYQLQQTFTQMKEPALAAQEAAWMKKFIARQKQASARPAGITTMPASSVPAPNGK